MSTVLRPGVPSDAEACGRVCYDAFAAIASAHNFPRDFPSPEVASGLMSALFSDPGFYSVVAERDGRIIGSNFLDVRSAIAGIGPITVDPAVQNDKVGALLMQNVIDHAHARNAAGIRLLQSAYHNRSLCLYTRLGFVTREPVSLLQGKPLNLSFDGYRVRPARLDDVATCVDLCRRVHGFDRERELRDAIARSTATVVEHLGRINGYSTGVAFSGHSVAESNAGLMALIGAASEFGGPGFLVPTRNHEVFKTCLDGGLRLVFQMTLMTIGLYNEPEGAWMPSVLF